MILGGGGGKRIAQMCAHVSMLEPEVDINRTINNNNLQANYSAVFSTC